MKTSTQSPGICYSYSANIDLETGIRYGVISQRSCSGDALDDILSRGTDLAWKKALTEALADARQEAESRGEDLDDLDEDRIADRLSDNWESDIRTYLYDVDGYQVTGCLSSDLMVMRSPYYTFAQFCSPCVPGAGNLDNPFSPLAAQISPAEIETMATAMGFPRVYCLGPDWFETGKAPYPCFLVKTN